MGNGYAGDISHLICFLCLEFCESKIVHYPFL